MKSTEIENIITPDMVGIETPTPVKTKNTDEKNSLRETLKTAGKVVVAGLIAGGAIASLASGFGAIVAGGITMGAAAISGLGALSHLAEAGLKIKDLIFNKNNDLQPQGV